MGTSLRDRLRRHHTTPTTSITVSSASGSFTMPRRAQARSRASALPVSSRIVSQAASISSSARSTRGSADSSAAVDVATDPLGAAYEQVDDVGARVRASDLLRLAELEAVR
jgi:hypothetical protein